MSRFFWVLLPTWGEGAPSILFGVGEWQIFGNGDGGVAFACTMTDSPAHKTLDSLASVSSLGSFVVIIIISFMGRFVLVTIACCPSMTLPGIKLLGGNAL